MKAGISLRNWLVAALAAAFVLATGLHTYIFVYYGRWNGSRVSLGLEYDFDQRTRSLRLRQVVPGGAAARGGLMPGDAVVAINGRPLETLGPYFDIVSRGLPGDVVEFSVVRAHGGPPATIQATLEPRADAAEPTSLGGRFTLALVHLYPVPFVLVGLTVLALRVQDRHAWLLALLFAGFSVGNLLEYEPLIHPALRGFAVAYSVLFGLMTAALFYTFLAVFPASSPLDRRVPWLKAILLLISVAVAVPLAAACLAEGGSWPVRRLSDVVGTSVFEASLVAYWFGAVTLGFVSIGLNCVPPAAADAQRKARLVAASFVTGVLPWIALEAAAIAFGTPVFSFPLWVWAPPLLLLMLLPVMFGYAVVKHRVLEFSVLVKRSARYLLVQRGFAVLTVALSLAVSVLFVFYGARWLPRLTDAALPVGIAAGALFGLLVVRTGGAVARRVTQRIDRAFFRQAYDAGHVLEQLAQKAGASASREDLASLLEGAILGAFHPRQVAVYLEGRLGALERIRGHEWLPRVLDAGLPIVERLARHGQPWTVPAIESAEGPLASPLAALEPECLVPIVGRRDRLVGVLALGPRLSEEPYSRDDRKLLASVASQAGLALESLSLAEEMAERIEVDRRARQEVEIAAEVQRRLLPRKRVAMTTLEYAARCRQARAVGGDYYDFLDLGSGRLGLVLGDVSGKGLYAALLMAHLQASLRSLSARAADDIATTLGVVNHSFCESTAGDHFATLFFGRYDDGSRRLQYANCGHHPPIVIRAAGGVERLSVTAGAVGLYEPWTCETREIALAPGDLLAAFSDGVTEALAADDEEFGESGLLSVLESYRQAPVEEMLDGVIDTVLAFAGREQRDDVTVLLAQVR